MESSLKSPAKPLEAPAGTSPVKFPLKPLLKPLAQPAAAVGLFLFFAGFASPRAAAAGGCHHPGGGAAGGSRLEGRDPGNAELALQIFEAAARLSPEITGELAKEWPAGGGPLPFRAEASEAAGPHPAIVTPYIKAGGQKIYLNSGFWKLTQYWLRLYLRELQGWIPKDLDPQAMIEEAQTRPPEDLISKKVKKIAYGGGEVVARWAYSYGKIYAVLKVSLEAAETVLSTAIGGKGMHAICRLNDIIIIVAVRRIQRYFRIISYGKTMNKGRLAMTLKNLWLSRRLKKAQRRAFFLYGQLLSDNSREKPFEEGEIRLKSQEALMAIDRGGRRPGSRLRWLQKISQKPQPISLSKARFLGKRSFLAIPRKRNLQYIRGAEFADQAISEGLFWPLAVQENILFRALEESLDSAYPDNTGFFGESSPGGPENSPDSVRRHLMEEFLSKYSFASEEDRRGAGLFLEALLQDIEIIFSAERPSFERYLNAHIADLSMRFFAEEHAKMLAAKIKELKAVQAFSEIRELQKHLGRFVYESNLFSDFLLSASMASDRRELAFHKPKSMKKALAFFGHLRETHQILASAALQSLTEVFESLEALNKEFASIAPGREKRTAFSFSPFRQSMPRCREMIMKARP